MENLDGDFQIYGITFKASRICVEISKAVRIL